MVQSPFKQRFPYDVICVIIRWIAVIDFPSLSSLVLVNKEFFGVAEMLRWRDITLSTFRLPALRSKLVMLTFRSARPAYIQRLRILCGHPVHPHHSLHYAAAIESLKDLLTRAKQLRVLRIIQKDNFTTSARGWHYFQGLDCINSDVIRDMHLTEFEYRGPKIRDPRLWELLSLQPSIQRLCLQDFGQDDGESEDDEDGEEELPAPVEYEPPLSKTALPNLEAVNVPYLTKLAAGRPVRYASVGINTTNDLQRLWIGLSGSSCHITALSVIWCLDDQLDPFITLLACNLPQLRYLSCRWFHAMEPNALRVGALNSIRALAALEFIRWEYTFTRTPDARVYDPRCTDPSGYAGASLKHVQCDVSTTLSRRGGITYRAYWDLAVEQSGWRLDFFQSVNPPSATAFPVDQPLDPIAYQFM